jgi:osmotically inducible lipoprotein OsmB
MKRIGMLGITALSLVALSACGTTPGERALSGGGIGAATGAAAGAILGGPVLGAALLGGAVGAGAGALTSPSQVDLGRPAWK